jgi:hypothetical protein
MSSDAPSPSLSASRSLTSFLEQLDSFDSNDFLHDEEANGLERQKVVKYLRCIRGFLTSARARIIEAQPKTLKEQLAMLSEPIQQLSNHIFYLEREDQRTSDELKTYITDAIKKLSQCHEQIAELASELSK